MQRIGVIGVGRMGGAMAARLLKAGFSVTVCDVQQSAVAAMVAQGARPAKSPKEVAAASEAVVVMVVDDAQTREVVMGPDGILEGAQAGIVVLLCSSLKPSTVRELGVVAQRHGVHILDAPVTGGERGAQEGSLAFYVGGDGDALQRVMPALKAMGPHVVHVGALGSGQVVKTVNNVLLWTTLAATAEALRLATIQGVSIDAIRHAMQWAPANNQWLRSWWEMANAPWIAKDLNNALAIAEEGGVSVPVIALAREALKSWRRPERAA